LTEQELHRPPTPAAQVETPSARRMIPTLVLQGGGALGPYQAGMYEALARTKTCPDWIAGVSTGSINAALIAGNPPERRVARLREFWEQASSGLMPTLLPHTSFSDSVHRYLNQLSATTVATFGAPGFFKRRIFAPLFAFPGSLEALSFYDTAPLRETLLRLVDCDLLNDGAVRVSVGAVNIRTGNSVVFDSVTTRIGPEHIMAPGALPPGFPPVEIEGELYWDGGLVSNTPLEFVMDAAPDCDLLVCKWICSARVVRCREHCSKQTNARRTSAIPAARA
jgi:NTE family protein